MSKYLSAILVASSLVLAGCSAMSDAGNSIKDGASSLGTKAKNAVTGGSSEETTTTTTTEEVSTDGSASQAGDTMVEEQTTTTTTETESSSEPSMMDKAKSKAGDYTDKAKGMFSK